PVILDIRLIQGNSGRLPMICGACKVHRGRIDADLRKVGNAEVVQWIRSCRVGLESFSKDPDRFAGPAREQERGPATNLRVYVLGIPMRRFLKRIGGGRMVSRPQQGETQSPLEEWDLGMQFGRGVKDQI